MINRTRSIYVIELLLLALVLVSIGILDNAQRELVCICGLGAILFISLLIYGKKKDNNTLKVSATRIVVSILLFFFIILFLLGIPLGFNETFFSLDVNRWFEGLIPALFFTVFMEVLRFIVITSNPFHKKGIWFLTILLILLNISINANFMALGGSYAVFVFLCVTVFPVIAQESLSSYITYQFGLLPNLVYKLIMNLYLYVLPIMTNLGNYLYGAFNVVIPFAIFITLHKSIHFANDAKKNQSNMRRVLNGFVVVPVLILMITLMILVSGVFNYQMIAVASNSMEPIFSRGDALVFEKTQEEDDVLVGDILVFRRDKKIVAHRVMKISRTTKGKTFFTKGDANSALDSDYVKYDDVLGIARSTVKFVGYPTVLLNEMIGGE